MTSGLYVIRDSEKLELSTVAQNNLFYGLKRNIRSPHLYLYNGDDKYYMLYYIIVLFNF